MTAASLASVQLSGVLATSKDALRRRLLGPWALGLKQYLALRLDGVGRADLAFRELRRRVADADSAELLQEPGPKAAVYRLARQIALELRDDASGPDSIPFRASPAASLGYRSALERVRRELPADDSELVELRFARELTIPEIARVLDLPEPIATERLDAAVRRARHILGGYAPDPHATRGGALVDAYALAKDALRDRVADDALQPFPWGTLIGGRYRLVVRVGVGTFGDVYQADDADVPGHRVALKILREPSLGASARDAALRELKLIAAVFHPSVVQFKDHGWHEDRLWFVMPWYEGETLEQRMRRGGLSRAEARRIFEPLARALATLHAQGIRHQDIKPENVLLARIRGLGHEGEELSSMMPVLIDLGVAAKADEALVGGTPVYFAPEVAAYYANIDEDERVIGPAADVFALALSLRNALEPESEEDVPAGAIEAFIERRANERPPLFHDRDRRWLNRSFERWLDPDPELRPTAAEFARELAVLTRPEERRARFRATLQWLIPLLIGLTLAFGALVYVFVRERQIQAREIKRARREAAEARADLMVEEARLQALDADHAALLQRYEQGQLTRQQLADQLATAEGQVEILRTQLAALFGERERSQSELASLQERLGQLHSMPLRRQLDAEQQRVRELANRYETLEAESRAAMTALEEELDDTRVRLQVTRRETTARIEQLEQQLELIELERDQALTDLTNLNRRLDRLRDVLDPSRPFVRNDESEAGSVDTAPPENPWSDDP